jgi:hypothetical protein
MLRCHRIASAEKDRNKLRFQRKIASFRSRIYHAKRRCADKIWYFLAIFTLLVVPTLQFLTNDCGTGAVCNDWCRIYSDLTIEEVPLSALGGLRLRLFFFRRFFKNAHLSGPIGCGYPAFRMARTKSSGLHVSAILPESSPEVVSALQHPAIYLLENWDRHGSGV